MKFTEITPEGLAERLKGPLESRPVLLDVRTREENALVALPTSLLIPLQELQARRAEIEALAGKEVVVYCHHGIRSRTGATFLADLGVTASSLTGGIDAYAQRVDPSLRRY